LYDKVENKLNLLYVGYIIFKKKLKDSLRGSDLGV